MGNKIFGEDIFINDGEYYSYHDLNDAFQELYTNNYFCALSSILNKKKNNNNNEIYQGFIRPSYNPMYCSN